jgi:hypothetical protein
MVNQPGMTPRRTARHLIAMAAACAASIATLSCSKSEPHQMFREPEEAVRALEGAVKNGTRDNLLTIFGPDAKELFDWSDPLTARRNREVFTVAMAEGWRLVDQGSGVKTLIVGNEAWPFPIPLVKDARTGAWRFDTEAGKAEILARRIGRNELAVIDLCRIYVAAQRTYARQGHDGQRAGLFARAFRSEPGRQNGLYWPAKRGDPRSPLGELVTDAAQDETATSDDPGRRMPFRGYYFKILTAQGGHAADGARDYVVKGQMSAGFALVAWPAEYDVTGVMTFMINQDGVVYERDLGARTGALARTMLLFNPDNNWQVVK